MKITMTFDEFEDKDSFETYTHATNYSLILYDIETKIRERMKYGELTTEAYKELEDLRQMISSAKIDYHLPQE